MPLRAVTIKNGRGTQSQRDDGKPPLVRSFGKRWRDEHQRVKAARMRGEIPKYTVKT